MSEQKWCHYCRKDNHNDSECSSTRPSDWKPGPADMKPAPYGSRNLVMERVIDRHYNPKDWK